MVRTVFDRVDPVLPAPEEIAGLVVMGGPQDADDDAHFPGLAAERALLAAATAAGVPVLGVCLGMQLLALALGGTLVRRGGTEIGPGPVQLSGDDPFLGLLGPNPTVVHWHQDQVTAPPEAVVLGSTPTTPVQAFRVGSAYGLQFHLEVDRTMYETWLTTADSLLDDDTREVLRQQGDLVSQAAALNSNSLQWFAAQVRSRG